MSQPVPIVVSPPAQAPGYGNGGVVVVEDSPVDSSSGNEILDDLPLVTAGEILSFEDDDFGEAAGRVVLKLGALALRAEVLQWRSSAVKVKMPLLEFEDSALARIEIRLANGSMHTELDVEFAPVLPTSQTPVEPDLPVVRANEVVTLNGQNLGSQPGKIQIKVGGLALAAELVQWQADSTTIRIPPLELEQPTKAELQVFLADGTPYRQLAVMVVPAAGGPESLVKK